MGTSEFSSMGQPVPEVVTSTGNALPRTGIGNLRVWVPAYYDTFFRFSMLIVWHRQFLWMVN